MSGEGPVLGLVVRDYRRRHFITQAQLAELVSARAEKPVSPATVARWETGSIPRPAQQKSLMEALGMSYEEFRAIIDEAERERAEREARERGKGANGGTY